MIPWIARIIFFVATVLAAKTVGGFLLRNVGPSKRLVSKNLVDRLVIGFYGSASAGKSSSLHALYGIDPGKVHPIPGTTEQVNVYPLPDNAADQMNDLGISLADTPGLDDKDLEIGQRAKGFIDNTDIFIYIINANGGIGEKVDDHLRILQQTKRPMLIVLNKIDTIKSKDRNGFIDNQRKISGTETADFLAAAFDPLPKISKDPINIDSVQQWIRECVKTNGKTLLEEKKSCKLI